MTPYFQTRFWLYLRLEIKKLNSALPKFLGGLCVILVILTGCALLYQLYTSNQQQKNVIQIGIVADPEEPYLDWIIQTIENMDSLEYTCKFTEVSESDGILGLQNGKYTALFIVPQDYIHSIILGKEAVLRIRFGHGQSTIASFLVKQLGNAASQILIDTQAGIYAMNDYYKENQLPNRSKDELSLNIRYLQKVLSRGELFTLEEVSGSSVLGDDTHYFAVGIILLFLALGLTCPSILHPEPRTLQDQLYVSGISGWKRMMAKECALILYFGFLYLILGILLTISALFVPALPEIMDITTSSPVTTALDTCGKLFILSPILVVICGWILFIYEAATDSISSLLLLFISMIFLGYVSGYFYPLSYLPDRMQHLASFLPTGVLLNYSYHTLTGEWHFIDFITVIGYGIIIYGLLVILAHTKRRISH